ncbi:MAG: adenylate/guanylate cyclase domain-containing protein [Bacteroidota bacterium]
MLSYWNTKEWGLPLLLMAFCWASWQPSLFGQEQPLIDSLEQALRKAPQDTFRVQLYNDLAWEYKFSEPGRARQLLDQSILLSQQLGYTKGEAQAHNNRGVVEAIAEQFETAKVHYEKALQLRQQLGDKKGVASLYNNIGNLEESLGNFKAAISNLRQSLKLRKELKDSLRIARVSYNIALALEAQGNYPVALNYILTHLSYFKRLNDEYEMGNAHNLIGNIKTELERFEEAAEHYEEALAIRQEQGDQWELAIVYQNIGNSKDDQGETFTKKNQWEKGRQQYELAINYYRQALELYTALEDREGEGGIYNNIGLVHKNLGSYYLEIKKPNEASAQFRKAMSFLNRSLSIRESIKDAKGIMEVYNGIGDVRRRQERYQEALDYTERYLAMAKELVDKKYEQKGYKDLSRVYAKLGNYPNAYEFRKLYDETRYDRLNEELVMEMDEREAQYGDLKKELELEQQKSANEQQQAQLRETELQRKSLFLGLLGLLVLAVLLYNRYRLKNKANQELASKNQIIEQERQRSEELLLNILPATTAQELKQRGKAAAQRYDSVTVLFTDFKSFTQTTEQLAPEALVEALDQCFRAFDEITSRHGIEKIKTIGDAYMCAGGLPVANTTHAADATQAALEMLAFMSNFNEQRRTQQLPSLETRIGLHSGPVIAGIVGSKKFAYDIWGDTVNTAARMESSGVPGRINISQTTYELIKDQFCCSHRGKIEAKNKGKIDMYFVEHQYNELPSRKGVYS